VILCVAANPSIDKLFAVDRIRPAAIHRPSALTRVAGGKGLNVARAAHTLGADVHAAALLAGHAGRWIEAELARLGLPLHAVWTEGETRSCLSVADAETRSLTEFYEDGPAVTAADWERFGETVRPLAARASWTALSGSLPPGATTGLPELAGGGQIALDTRDARLTGAALVKVNATEAAAATGLPVENPSQALATAAALRLQAGGTACAIVTLGAGGAVLADDEGRGWHGCLDAVGPYPVGSGDAFLAGIVVARERGGSWPEALRLGLAAGTANAELPGAGVLDAGRALELAAAATIVPLG
jgi:1-phosphofructokinase family hexose kinase